MAVCLAIVNQKGGVGKSTTAVNLGACLGELGKKVLLVDIDPQGNATSGVGIEKSQVERCMYDVLIEGCPIEAAVQRTLTPGLDAVPATLELAGAEIELVATMSREYKLKSALEPILANYDYILVDAPPSLGLLTINALCAATAALIPIQCEYYALEGVSQLMGTVGLVKEHLNPNLEICGILMTMYDARTNLSQQVVEEVQKFFGDRVFKAIIPRNVRLSEAPSHGQPIIMYDEHCRGASAYRELARELIGA
ncbi:MAG: ParA family protein [Firmicutes bacterium]|nr:ParA family protein [Bacillota bacterium]